VYAQPTKEVTVGLDETKGKLKETVGSVSGSDDLRREGQHQQQKAAEEERAEEARRQAEHHESKAEGHEGAERRHQGT
jgi:uncharacterized protein YjbJ (UPF0337 family)